MIPYYKMPPLKIVGSYPGSGTTETIYVTEDGAHWRQDSSDHSNETAPPRLGRLSNGVMLPR